MAHLRTLEPGWTEALQAFFAQHPVPALPVSKHGPKRGPIHGPDKLFALTLRELRIPTPVLTGRVRCRHPRPEELGLVASWRAACCTEVLGATPGPALL